MLRQVALALTVLSFSTVVSAQEAKAPIKDSSCKIYSAIPVGNMAFVMAAAEVNATLRAKGWDVVAVDTEKRAKKANKFCLSSDLILVVESHNSPLNQKEFQGTTKASIMKISGHLSTESKNGNFLCTPTKKKLDEVSLNFPLSYGIDKADSDAAYYAKMVENVAQLPDCEKK